MAIHADYPGLTVEIYVDGKPLEEYKNLEEENVPKTTTRYVECRSGAEFAIHTNFKAPFSPVDMGVCVRLDGSVMDRMFVNKHSVLNKPHTQAVTKWKEGGKWRASKFFFSDLSVLDQNSANWAEKSSELPNSVGIISVSLHPLSGGVIIPKARIHRTKRNLRDIGTVSEKDIKGDARSHLIRLAPDKAIKALPWVMQASDQETLTTFQFKYRSITALKSLGIVPRSPSPSPIPEPASIKKEASPEPTPNIVPNIVSPAATPRPKPASATPAPPQPKSVSPTPNEHEGLTDEDIIALIKHFRGNDKGLAGQNRKRLLVLLEHYEDKENDQVPIKQEAVPGESRVRIKREHTDGGAARGQGKKRKPEVIVLDD